MKSRIMDKTGEWFAFILQFTFSICTMPCQQKIRSLHVLWVCPLVAVSDFPGGGTGPVLRVSAACHAVQGPQCKGVSQWLGSRLTNHWLAHLNSVLLGFPLVDVMNWVGPWIRHQYELPYISHPVIIWPYVLDPQKLIHCEWAGISSVLLDASLSRVLQGKIWGQTLNYILTSFHVSLMTSRQVQISVELGFLSRNGADLVTCRG